MRHNPGMVGDPLSEVITLAKARSMVTGGFYAGGEWAVQFPKPNSVKFLAIVEGGCWMCLEGRAEPLRLEAGDFVATLEPRGFVLASEPSVEPVPSSCVTRRDGNAFASVGSGREFLMLGGHIAFDSGRGALLLDLLPPLIYVRGAAPEAVAIQQLLPQLVEEMRAPRAGGQIACGMLMQLVFIQVLRAHLASSEGELTGWLRALADERLAPVLHAMHGEPSRNWSLEELAGVASMSRSAFALHFKNVVGVTPVAYLSRWRMRLAEGALRDGSAPVSSVAYSLGYTSESAFSNAFKRVVGVSPKHYRASGLLG